MPNSHKHPRFTPEKAQAWSLAMYPAVILTLVIFMILTDRQVTTDIIGLFIGLIAAGSLQAVVHKKGNGNAKSDDSSDHSGDVRNSRRQELDTDDWRRPDDPDRWSNRRIRLYAG